MDQNALFGPTSLVLSNESCTGIRSERTPYACEKYLAAGLCFAGGKHSLIEWGIVIKCMGRMGGGLVKAASHSLTIISNGVQSKDAILYIQVSRRNLPRLKYSS